MEYDRRYITIMVVVLVWGLIRVGLSDEMYVGKTYISWDDMVVDQVHKIWPTISRVDYNQSRLIVVDKNGGGDSLTVQGAIDMVPHNNKQRVKIFVLPGIYREKVIVPSSKPYISLIGNETQMSNTIISWNNKASDKDSTGANLGTYRSASVTVESDYFCATQITFENTVIASAGEEGRQAVALRICSDKAMLYKVKVVGTQDTLLDETGFHYFYQCHIIGSVDFIFGKSTSLYQECLIESNAEKYGAIAAHHRDSPDEKTGFSFVGCQVNGTGQIYLGRAWGNYSRIIYANTYLDNIITSQGWSDWDYPFRQKTAVFGEFQCQGGGANTTGRVPWSKKLSYEEAKPFLDMRFINGQQWLRL